MTMKGFSIKESWVSRRMLIWNVELGVQKKTL